MRAGVIAIALSSTCFLWTLSACSGGGSSVAPNVAALGAGAAGTPSSAPTPAASPSPYPRTAGDTFVYSGQLQQAFQTFPEVVPPGTPAPEPTSLSTTNVTQTVTVKTNQSFNGTSGLAQLHDAETDALTSGLKTSTSTTDTYESVPQSGSTALLSYGSQFADEAGDTTSTLYAPPLVLDQLPQTPGARWSNGPAGTIDEALAGNATGSAVTVVRSVNSDGSYSEKTTYPPNYSAPGYTGVGQIQENADGSGTFSFVANGSAISITYSQPEPQPSGPPLITVKEYGSLNTTGTASTSFQLPAWYGNVPALYAETDQDQGTQPIPSACGLANTLPAHGTALAQTISRTDTILGYTEQETTTSYVAAGYGTLCTISTDKQTFYYDFTGDQKYAFTATTPLQITTVNQVLALQPSSQIAATTTLSVARAGSPVQTLDIAGALRANFERAVRGVHRRRAAGLARAAASLRAKGVSL